MRIIYTTIALVMLLPTSSCTKRLENYFSCVNQGGQTKINYTADTSNTMTAFFKIDYIGSFELENEVTWDFGDGTTSSSQGLEVAHTYKNKGEYEVKARPVIKLKNELCSPHPHKTVVIN